MLDILKEMKHISLMPHTKITGYLTTIRQLRQELATWKDRALDAEQERDLIQVTAMQQIGNLTATVSALRYRLGLVAGEDR